MFYEPNILETNQLSEEESRHCIKVLRKTVGDQIEIVDGKGNWYKAKISKAQEKKCEVSIIQTQHDVGKRNFSIHLAIAPTKNADRMEWMIEKCTEIGIDEISFLETRYSERKVQRLDRLEKIAISAMKQSGQAFLPKLNEMQKISAFLNQHFEAQKYIAHLEEGERKLLSKIALPLSQYLILIGPEGDFSEEEIKMANKNGFISVSLGETRLRTETAGLVSCMTLNFINS